MFLLRSTYKGIDVKGEGENATIIAQIQKTVMNREFD